MIIECEVALSLLSELVENNITLPLPSDFILNGQPGVKVLKELGLTHL
jgi:hypothetical protein